MELTLKLLTGRNAGQEIRIPAKKFFIGRAEDCHLRPHSDLISRHHCALIVEGGVCAVRDFGSRNGTFVNDEAVQGERVLKHGDRLKVAHLEFEVQLASGIAAARRPRVKDVKDAAQRTAAPVGGSGDEDISDWLTEEEAHGDTKGLVSPTSQASASQVGPSQRLAAHETPHPTTMSTHDTLFLKAPTEDTTTTRRLESKKPAELKTPAEPVKPEGNTDEAKKEDGPAGAGTGTGAGAAGERTAETAQRLFGKPLKAGGKNPSKSSGDAAAEALKKFFNTRRT